MQIPVLLDRSVLPPAGQSLVIAVSGGADSIALWGLLAQLGEHPLIIAHIDHGIRADSAADGDAIAAMPLPGTRMIERHDVPALALAWRCGLEEAGRRCRYAAFARIAAASQATVIATAHHRDDQAETILMHLLRGSHGLRGMPRIRRLPTPGSAATRPLHLIRPLLSATRDELRAWLRQQGLPWREDPSNADCRFRRNHLRHRVLPTFEAGCPGFTAALVQAAATTGEDPPLIAALRAHGIHPSRALVRRLQALPPGARLTQSGWLITREAADAWAFTPEHAPTAIPPTIIPGPGTYHRAGRTLHLSPATSTDIADPRAAHARGVIVIAMADMLQFLWPLHWREPLPGDRWQPLGCTGTQTVLHSLATRHVSPPERAQRAVLCDQHGPLWLEGVTIAERARVQQTIQQAWAIRMTTTAASTADIDKTSSASSSPPH